MQVRARLACWPQQALPLCAAIDHRTCTPSPPALNRHRHVGPAASSHKQIIMGAAKRRTHHTQCACTDSHTQQCQPPRPHTSQERRRHARGERRRMHAAALYPRPGLILTIVSNNLQQCQPTRHSPSAKPVSQRPYGAWQAVAAHAACKRRRFRQCQGPGWLPAAASAAGAVLVLLS